MGSTSELWEIGQEFDVDQELRDTFYAASSQRRPASAMKVKIVNWHAVASWTWTTEDDVCGICHMPLDGCAPGAAGPGDDSPVVWGRVRRLIIS